MITMDQLSRAAPHAASAGRLAVWYPAQVAAMMEFDIITDARIQMFLANELEETGEFAIERENMHYSAERLMEVWPSLFPDPSLADTLAAEGPEAIANYVYDDVNRPPGYKLGNVFPGDGWKFRGTGPMQDTGRTLIQRTFTQLGMPFDSDPNLLCEPTQGSRASAYFWKMAGCNELADEGDFLGIVKHVNGGYTNLALRTQYLGILRSAMQ